jgi:hypothetical protein
MHFRLSALTFFSMSLVACGDGPSAQQIIDESQRAEEARKRAEVWSYSNQVDEMRGKTERVAVVRAQNWGSMAPTLGVHELHDLGTQVTITGSYDEVAAPKMRCPGYVNIKFDDGPIRKIKCHMGMSVLLDQSIISDLRTSKVTWIEIDTSIGSTQQYKFSTAGLKL